MVRSPQLTVTSGAIIGFFVSLLFIGSVLLPPQNQQYPRHQPMCKLNHSRLPRLS